MKDVLGMTGVELGSKRRKSMAPSGLGRTCECQARAMELSGAEVMILQ